MKKTLVVASIACAFASAFNAYADAETPPRYLNWFDAIGTGASSESSLDPTNGTWDVQATGDKSWSAADGLAYDLTTGYVTFTATQAAAPDTDTVTRVSLESYFSPIVCSDVSEIPSLNGSTEQIGFAAVAVTNAAGEATFKYCAWTGDGWFALDGAEPNDEEDVLATLTAELDYRDAVPTVKFSIATNGAEGAIAYNLKTGTTEVVAIPVTSSKAASDDKFNGFKCGGCGNVKSAQGLMAEAIAQIGDKKFISLTEASEAATAGSVIDVLAETSESIELVNGVSISNANGKVTGVISAGEGSVVTVDLNADDIGNGTNGTYTVDVKTSTSGSGAIAVIQPLPNKEIADGTTDITSDHITVTIHTKTALLQEMRPDSANMDKALAVDNTTNSPLRVFLDTYCPDAYRADNADTATIESALQGTGANGLQLWQDYVLTIEPDTVVSPIAPVAGDASSDYITLTIPNLSGVTPIGYTVRYDVYKGEDVVATASSAGEIRIPVSEGSGKYTVKAVLIP